MRYVTLALFVAVISASAAHAAGDPKLISTHGAWSAYKFTENGNAVCYMAATPKKAEGDYTRRGEIFALITHRPAEDTKNVFSYITGYPYKENSEVTVIIGDKRFTLFTQDETAWTPDSQTDNKLVQAIRKGYEMVVKGVSARGTETTDTFSLKGSAAAHNAISRECKVSAN